MCVCVCVCVCIWKGARCFCGSVVEHCVSSVKGCGFDSQETLILTIKCWGEGGRERERDARACEPASAHVSLQAMSLSYFKNSDFAASLLIHIML